VNAVDVVERFADGKATLDEVRKARDEAYKAYGAAYWGAYRVAYWGAYRVANGVAYWGAYWVAEGGAYGVADGLADSDLKWDELFTKYKAMVLDTLEPNEREVAELLYG